MLLGLDLGTTNVKALVTDPAGRVLARGACGVRLFHLGGGGVEQEIEEIWQATLTAIRQSLRGLEAASIQALGVSSQGGALQMLDAHHQPLGRVISWLDERGRSGDDAVTAELGPDWFRSRIGHGRCGYALGQLLRFRRETPELLEAPRRVGFVGDVIVSRLCGRSAHDGTSCGLTLLHNPRLRTYDPDLLQRLGLETSQLPDLIPACEAAGGLRPEVAKETGLRPGLPVSAAVHDQYASALGTGAVRAGTVMLGTGTAWVLLAVSGQMPALVTDDAFVCGHVIEGLFGQILSLVNGGSSVTWALELTGLAGKEAREIEALLETVPAGSEGLSCWPFLAPVGAPGLPAGTKGRLSGLQLVHRPAHLVRAVVEGLACELNRHLVLLREAGQPADTLVLGGGAASSRVTPQILADITGQACDCPAGGEASLLGAAVLARGLLEPRSSLADLARDMAPPVRRVEPGPDAAFYQEQFQHYLRSVRGQPANLS